MSAGPRDDRPGAAGTHGEAREGDGQRSVRLPTVDVPEPGPEGDAAPDGGPPSGAGGLPPRQVEVSSIRLVLTLALAGAVAGLIIVLVHQWAQPRIEEHQARVLREAIYEVLGGPERYETAFLVDGSFTTSPPPTADTASLERVYVGYDENGAPVGVAVAGAQPGFQDVIRLIFGYDPDDRRVLGMKVLENKETPGLGDKIVKDSAFVAEFSGVTAPLLGVKSGAGDDEDNEVDMITGATISSRAVIDIINGRLATLGEPLGSWWSQDLRVSANAGGSR